MTRKIKSKTWALKQVLDHGLIFEKSPQSNQVQSRSTAKVIKTWIQKSGQKLK